MPMEQDEALQEMPLLYRMQLCLRSQMMQCKMCCYFMGCSHASEARCSLARSAFNFVRCSHASEVSGAMQK